jgi:hypothetical protein
MAGGVVEVAAFAKDPALAGVVFAESEKIGRDILVLSREALLGERELVHEGKTEVVLLGGEIDASEPARELMGCVPADLASQAGLVSGRLEAGEMAEEKEESGAEEVPIVGTASEESLERKVIAFDLVDVNGCEVALAAGGDIETEAVFGWGGENFAKRLLKIGVNSVFSVGLGSRIEVSKAGGDVGGFEVEAFDWVIKSAAFEGIPVDE